jgi:hypothetical protein
MKKLFLSFVVTTLLVACGPQEHSVNIPNTEHTIGGKAYSYVVVQFDFITSIQDLCSDLHPQKDFGNQVDRDKKIAECVFDNLSLLDIGMVNEFKTNLCDTTTEAYINLTPEEKLQVDQLCEAL